MLGIQGIHFPCVVITMNSQLKYACIGAAKDLDPLGMMSCVNSPEEQPRPAGSEGNL